MTLRRGADVAVTTAAICIVGASIKFAAPFLVPVLLAGFIAAITAPMMLWIIDRGVPRWIGVTLGITVDILVVVILAWLVAASMESFVDKAPVYQAQTLELVEETSALLAEYGLTITPATLLADLDTMWLMGAATDLMRRLANLLSEATLVLLIVAFMLVEATDFRAKLLSVLGDEQDLERFVEGADEVKLYMVVKTVASVATGLLAGLWCFALGLDHPIFWGLVAFALNYIPNLGSIAAGALPMAFALVTQGVGPMLAVGAGFLAINFVIGNGIEPRVMGQALGLSPFVVMLAMVVWGWLLGPMGALLSAPLTMILRHWLSTTEDFAWGAVFLGPARATGGRRSLRPPKPARPGHAGTPPGGGPSTTPTPSPHEGK